MTKFDSTDLGIAIVIGIAVMYMIVQVIRAMI